MAVFSHASRAAWVVLAVLTVTTQLSAQAVGVEPSGARPPSPEGEPAGYREAVEQALSELSVGHFSEARAMFLHAHTLFPNARTLRGLGLAEFELRSYVECIEHLEQSLASGVRPLDAQLREETERLLERASRYVTRLSVHVTPATATVRLDGAPVDVAGGRTLLLTAGDHRLDVEAPEKLPAQRTVHALGGDTQALTLALTPQPPPARSESESPRRLRKNPWLWVGVSALVAGAAVTAGVLVARRGSETEPPYGGTSGVIIPGF